MITTVTTHNLKIFKLFYTHKYHNILKQNMIIYIDNYDSSEFRKIIGNDKVKVFDKNDIKEYYKDIYMEEYKYGAKVYFINMLCKLNLLNDSLYFTDDDVLIYNEESFKNIESSDKIIHSKDFMHFDMYKVWPKINDYIKQNINIDNITSPSTNVFIPKCYIKEFSENFIKVFEEFIPIIFQYKYEFIKLDNKSKSLRNTATLTFYLDTPFFNCVYQRMRNVKFQNINFQCCTYKNIFDIKIKLKTNNPDTILNYYINKLKLYPQKQPIIHIYITNKLQLMKVIYNYLNNIRNYENINDLFKQTKFYETKPLF